MMTVETAWNQFRRKVVEPYWCKGSPLAWHDRATNIGIAHFAKSGDVGHFNLAWWLLARTEPPSDGRVYANTRINWVILKAPHVKFGQHSLTALASTWTQQEWNRFIADPRIAEQGRRFEGHGVAYSDLLLRATVGSRT